CAKWNHGSFDIW
nr:immunoglobulin heavy chain junction region [Macaca mulatta]MOW26910.1 immunoglobulin heavy chain junction region [Macaca mulatta]